MIESPTSILVFRNGSVGNTLVAVPALRALHYRYPTAKLSVVVDSIGYELLKYCPWVQNLIIYDKKTEHKSFFAFIELVLKLRGLTPSHAILFKRFYRNGLLALLSGSKIRVGFETNGNAPFLNLKIPYDETVNIIDLNLRLAAIAGASSTDKSLEMFFSDGDRSEAQNIMHEHSLTNERYLAIHYGGQTSSPDFFSIKQFGNFVKSIANNDYKIVLIGNGVEEYKNAQIITEHFSTAVNLVGLPIRVTALIIKNAKHFIGFNSGPLHIASAVKTPATGLFKLQKDIDNEIIKWAPPVANIQSLIVAEHLDDNDLAKLSQKVRHFLLANL